MDLGDLPGGDQFSLVSGVSADGTTAVGRSISAPPQPNGQTFEAFRWTQATGMVGLGDIDGGAVRSEASAVSADGSLVVGSVQPEGAARWTIATGWQQLAGPMDEVPGFRPTCVSMVGSVIAGLASPITGGTVAARWTAATGVVNLGALPNTFGFPDAFLSSISADGNVGTGNSSGLEGVHPLHWSSTGGLIGLGDVPGGIFYALGNDISADGRTIIGSARTSFPESPDEAFIWREGSGFQLLDPDHGAFFGSVAYGVSADGSVVVGYYGGVGGSAMLWDEAHGARSIRDTLTNQFGIDLTGWVLGTAWDVSADGSVIVGNGTNPQGKTAAWVARIPRPTAVPTVSTWSLVVMVVVILACASAVLAARRNQRDPTASNLASCP